MIEEYLEGAVIVTLGMILLIAAAIVMTGILLLVMLLLLVKVLSGLLM